MRVNYLAIFGMDGAGKTTAFKIVEKYMKSIGRDVVSVHEPGGTPIGQTLRTILKSPSEERIDSISEALLFFTSRNQLLKNVVMPSLRDGKFVISDRCFICSQAMQGFSGNVPDGLMNSLVEHAVPLKPDAYIYLDVEPRVGLARVMSRGELDRIESKGLEYFYKVREGYLKYVNQQHTWVIDANKSLEDVEAQLLHALKQLFGE